MSTHAIRRRLKRLVRQRTPVSSPLARDFMEALLLIYGRPEDPMPQSIDPTSSAAKQQMKRALDRVYGRDNTCHSR